MVCSVDERYYRDEARKLADLARDYLRLIGETWEGREMVRRYLRWPDLEPLPAIVTHRRVLERLHAMVDFLCQLEGLLGLPEDGWMIEKRRDGVIYFIPPTEEQKHGRPEYGWHWEHRAAA